MQQPTLKANLREAKVNVRQLRRDNQVPAVIYSKDSSTQSITISHKEFDKMLRTFGQNTLFKVDVEGNVSPALVREVQRDTLKDTILHADFLRVSMDEEIQFELSIVLKGDAAGIKAGGVLQHQKRTVAAKSLAKNMPENVEIDISGLGIGDTITVADIVTDDNVEILDSPEEVIVSMLAPRLAEEAEEETEEGGTSEEAGESEE